MAVARGLVVWWNDGTYPFRGLGDGDV